VLDLSRIVVVVSKYFQTRIHVIESDGDSGFSEFVAGANLTL
jgi:hypothetical protein